MDGENLRRELADITKSLRCALERELHAGGGDLIATAAKQRHKMAARGGAGTAPAAGAAARGDRPAVPGPPPAVPAEEMDLFGEEAPKKPAKMTPVTAGDVPAPLPPLDPAARAAIARAAEPVLAKIAEDVRACRSCALWETRNQAVPGVGSALAGIAFVGEAPGAEEDRLGEPFVGRGGQLLDRIIKAMDDAQLIPGLKLDRSAVFIGNVLHCRPPENRVPLPFEVEQSSPHLRRQLEALRPRIICCLGKTAAEHLLGSKASLASMRGRVYRVYGAKLIVTYHPAAVLRNPELKRPVWEDMQLLAREYRTE